MAATSSYIDHAAILSPTFTPTAYANTLVHATNNASDTPLDLSTPLSRVLFDVQEIDTHIDALTTTHADRIIGDTRSHARASTHLVAELDSHVAALQENYARLEREVIERYEAAEEVRMVAERLVQTLRLGRAVQRVVQFGRQLEMQLDEAGPRDRGSRALLQAAMTAGQLRAVLRLNAHDGLQGVRVVGAIESDLLAPGERTLLARAQQVVKEFSMSSLVLPTTSTTSQSRSAASPSQPSVAAVPTFAQSEEAKTRAANALRTLYLLSPVPLSASPPTAQTFAPALLLTALTSYVQTALTSSLAALARALANLPTLDRALVEVSARCQNLVALEAVLATTQIPTHPLLGISSDSKHVANGVHIESDNEDDNQSNDGNERDSALLALLLHHLDTSSLPSYFWRSMAGQLGSRVQEVLNRGGVSARTLRSNRDRLRDAIRECVDRGSRLPGAVAAATGTSDRSSGLRTDGWEREAAVMVSSVLGPLQR